MASAAVLFQVAGARTICLRRQADIAPAANQLFPLRTLPHPLFEGSRLGRSHSEDRVGSGLRRFFPRAKIPQGQAESTGSSNGFDSVPQAEQVKDEAQALKSSIQRAENRIERLENQIDTAAAAGKRTELLEQRLVALEQRLAALRQKEAALEQRLTALAQAEVEKLKLQQTPAAGVPDPAVLERLQKYAEFIAQTDTASGIIQIPPELREGLPPGLRDSILIRECYCMVLKKLEALGDDFAVVLSGTPGIGKSAIAVLLLHHLAEQGAQVAYRYMDTINKDTIIFFDFSNPSAIDVKQASEGDADWRSLRALCKRSSVWLVQDGRAPRETQFPGYGRWVVLCSPNSDNYMEFVKGKHAEVWWLPVWTLDELLDCRQRFYPHVSQKQTEDRFEQFGGVVRSVLADPGRSFERLARSLSALEAVDLYRLGAAALKSAIRHAFAHIEATQDLEFDGFRLGSPRIGDLVFQRAKEGRWQDLVDLLHAAASNPRVGEMSGSSLEAYGHVRCVLGADLDDDDIKEVFRKRRGRPRKQEGAKEGRREGGDVSESDPGQSGKREEAVEEIKEAFRSCKDFVSDSKEEGINPANLKHTYVRPTTRDQESWDGLLCPGGNWIYAVQFTRNPGHGISAQGMLDLLKRIGRKRLRVVLAVPGEKFDNYGWQPWTGPKRKGGDGETVMTKGALPENEIPPELKSIKQWVVRLKLPDAGDEVPRIPEKMLVLPNKELSDDDLPDDVSR
ncbi:hypothetical protein KFL_003110020 [Klebsormidium nitens]|uniref:Uncharacterized protein n=1 Tax=Klebsormidium nitens TaxID=105231 RepID=A0A1Y1ICI3_KLENI|nr:hypothetical protein KFL_003110020 [Klebsormidium nitens]|eukprot:GAQ86781.1 hypothetical protein KFL_003110020 [Klebsormidium nitens]